MSWSVSAIGKPAAVKVAISKQFESCLPLLAQNAELKHEHASAALAQESIEAQLNFLIEKNLPCAVRVSAAGSAWVALDAGERMHGSTHTSLTVETIPGFVE